MGVGPSSWDTQVAFLANGRIELAGSLVLEVDFSAG